MCIDRPRGLKEPSGRHGKGAEPMKKEVKKAKVTEPDTKAMLLRRNPVPFGDVRKYYYAACIGTVILLALCFHISVVAIALRTDTCEQLSNALIVFLLFFCIAAIIGHQTRTLLGYGISALSSLIILLLLQFYHGTGVMILSNQPEYGEVFRDGAKSTDFWILLAKAVAVIHMLLSIVFINSTIKVKEEPPLKGMNVQIQKFKDWLDKNNNSLPAGRRASDYWFVVASILLWMVFAAYDPTMGKFDYWSLCLLLAGSALVFLRATFSGAFLLTASALIRCTLYQWRFGVCIPVVAAYLGMWVALLYLAMEAMRVQGLQKKTAPWVKVTQGVFIWGAIAAFVICLPIHEFTSAFSGSYMLYQKDNLPLIFFLPIVVLLLVLSKNWLGYLFGAAGMIWLWDAFKHATPLNGGKFFYLLSLEEHGTVGEDSARRLTVLVNGIMTAAIIAAVLCVLWAGVSLYYGRKGNHGTK